MEKEIDCMSQEDMDKNIIVVAAVEGYAHKHKISTKSVLCDFQKAGLLELLRSQYEVLHTQDLSESVLFAEDVLARRN